MGEIELRAECHGHALVTMRAEVERYERPARLRRAAAVFFPLLLLALVSVPIPGWHVAAVPGFGIAAVVLGLRRLRQRLVLREIRGPCAACGKASEYPLPDRAEPPLTVRCPACGEFLKLSELR